RFIEQTISGPRGIRLTDFWGMLADAFSMRDGNVPLWSYHDPLDHQHQWRALVLCFTLACGAGWLTGTHRRPLVLTLPIAVLAVVLGTLQSQSFMGSTYGLYPFAGVMLCTVHRAVHP